MNPIAKKKIVTPKPKAATFKRPSRKPTVKATNGVAAQTLDAKELEEYLVYKKLKAEVGEFYPKPSLWLEAPHEMLGGRTPLEIALSSRAGTEIILDLIASIKAGHFS